MKAIARSLVVVFVALIAVPALAVSYTIATAVQLLAVTGFYMGGTQHPLTTPPDDPAFISNYMNLADHNYIFPATHTDPTTQVAVVYPAEFFPVFGSTTFDDSVAAGRSNLNSCLRGGPCNGGPAVPRTEGVGAPGTTFDVFGYSQSAVVASLVKRDIIANRTGVPTDTNFVLIANPMRPNGGILARGFEGMTIPILGITFYGATPTNSCAVGGCLDTTDVAQQYDFLGGDAPARPLNVLAMANSLAAYAQLHGDVPNHQIGEPGMINQGKYGDTQYYLITADRLPILLPLQTIGVPGPILAVVDAPLRVLIEDAYIRGTSPGQPVPFQIVPIGNPVNLIANLAASIPVGIDDGLQEAGIGQALGNPRPLGTADVYRPFGVGGQAYSKVDGKTPVDDPSAPQNVLTTAPLQSGPTTLASPAGDKKQIDTAKPSKLNNETADVDSPPAGTVSEVTKPRPLQVLRDSLKFDPPKPPSGTHPSGDGPLKKIVGALTGQPPKSAASGAGADKAA